MFTGLIQSIGHLHAKQERGGDARFTFTLNDLDLSNIEMGASIAVNGVCLTAVEWTANTFVADASKETLALTTLGNLPLKATLNFEKSLTLQTPLGGHLVSGHVDGIAEVLNIEVDLIARYIERLFGPENTSNQQSFATEGLTYEKILSSGLAD